MGNFSYIMNILFLVLTKIAVWGFLVTLDLDFKFTKMKFDKDNLLTYINMTFSTLKDPQS